MKPSDVPEAAFPLSAGLNPFSRKLYLWTGAHSTAAVTSTRVGTTHEHNRRSGLTLAITGIVIGGDLST